MLTFTQASKILETLFLTEWNSLTPVETKNISYKPETGQPWVRFSVMERRTTQPELGRSRKRHYGQVYMEVFIPAYRGDAFDSIVTSAENLIQMRTTAEGIILDASAVDPVGVIPKGSWSLSVVSVPFYYDEIVEQPN